MRDDEGPMNTKSSIFICGPPGTGKVRSLCFCRGQTLSSIVLKNAPLLAPLSDRVCEIHYQ
jgi:hypothetical protein